MEAILGKQLRSKARGSVATLAALRDSRFVLVYCSASWCPPCRQFTPVLGAFYTSAAARLKASFVLVSNDRDEASFQAYFKHMPWDLALSPEDSAGQALMQRFGIRGIPSLMVFSASSGALLTKGGVEALSRDPSGAGFPWAGPGAADIGRRVTMRDRIRLASQSGKLDMS